MVAGAIAGGLGAALSPRTLGEDHRGGFFSDHHSGGIDVAIGHTGHDGSIHHVQPLQSMYLHSGRIDHGEGISVENKTRIFEEFVQVSPNQQMGTGLGLPISRRLATLLDGSLDVESVVGEGSTFTLKLPAKAQLQEMEIDGSSAENAAEDQASETGPNEAEKSPEKERQKEGSKGVRVA